jgi:hypothetical protein
MMLEACSSEFSQSPLRSTDYPNVSPHKTMTYYHHTQIGYAIIIAVDLAIILIIALLLLYEFNWIPVIVLVFLGICTFLFASLTVEIDEEYLSVRFGTGLIRKTIALRHIVTYQNVRNHWYYGWGIRQISRGWMFNVSGLDAVELDLQDGKRFRIGTNDPQGLMAALRQTLGR